MSFTLPNFLNAGFLNALRAQMKAPLTDNFKIHSQYRPIEWPIAQRLLSTGVNVELRNVDVWEDGTLAFQGHRVLLYIRDVPGYGGRSAWIPRYHVAHCQTLEKATNDTRVRRYIGANWESSIFTVNFLGPPQRTEQMKLDVCQHCLALLQWRGFTDELSAPQKQQIVQAFTLEEFFTHYPRNLLSIKPQHTADTAPINTYTADWKDVAESTKRQRGYICEKCGVRPAPHETRFLHVHHRDGVKFNNSDSNLQVLCVACHADEPMHGHMRRRPDYLEFVASRTKP